MSKAKEAAAWAEALAADDANGYDQANRWGPDWDCSSLVIQAYENAGIPVKSRGATYTENMVPVFLSCGFRDVKDSIDLTTGAGLQRGDVLVNVKHHAAICIGGGRIVNAGGNEFGGAVGGRTGDQTGREIRVMNYYLYPQGWDHVLRYEGDPSPSAREDRVYTVKHGDSLWSIAERLLGDGFRFEELRKLNGLDGYVIYPGQVLRLPGDPSASPGEDRKETRSLTLKKGVWAALEKKAAARGLTIEQMTEEDNTP